MDVPSSAAGVVKEVLVNLGDKVGEGAVLIKVEAAGAPAGAAAAANTTPASAPAPIAASASPSAAPAAASHAGGADADHEQAAERHRAARRGAHPDTRNPGSPP